MHRKNFLNQTMREKKNMTNRLKDLIIGKMKFSYSSVSSFNTCKYGFYLTYIDNEERESNFFAEYGSFCHEILEKYWKRELKQDDLQYYYIENYYKNVVTQPPVFPRGMALNFYNSGLEFFTNIDMNIDDYDVLLLEDKIISEIGGVNLIVKPDLVVRNKKSGKVYLLDYKTSKPMRKEKWDKKKLAEYEKQLQLYAHFITEKTGIKIDKILLLFIRLGKTHTFAISQEKTQEVLDWFVNTVQAIKIENDFIADPSSKFFCSQLCSVRSACPFWDRSYMERTY